LPATPALRQPLSYAASLAGISVAYLIAGRLSLALAIPPGYATAVWPPSGIALAAVLLFGVRAWPAIWIGAALVNFEVHSSVFAAALIATGNTLEALAGRALIVHHVGDPAQFRRGEDAVKFIALCALASSIAPSIGLIPLAAGSPLSWGESLRNWWTWWQGDLSGMIIVAPLIVSWSRRESERRSLEKNIETAVFGALLLLAAVLLVTGDNADVVPFSLTFVTLPFIIWGAFRLGQREVSSAVAVVCAIAIWYTLQQLGAGTDVPLNERLLLLLTFNGMVVTTGLVLVSVVGERARAMQPLLQSKQAVPSAPEPLSDVSNETPPRQTVREGPAEKLLLEKRLRRAIENDEFVLVYQPIVDVLTRKVSGVEALMRLKSPGAGLLSPLHFIPLLEETGLILDVGKWALQQALRDQAAWTAEDVTAPRIAVNVSPIQLRHLHFVEHVQEATARAPGTPLIDLEITESHFMEDLVPAIAKLTRIREMGIGVAIDDFGTGYSSLAYLTKLPVNVLKVDRTFISSMLEDDNAMTMVQTILSVAAALKLRTVAEGVESDGQADMLALLGCDEMQGYLISPPVFRTEITPLLAPSS